MKTNQFTPQELLAIAKEVMPLPKTCEWRVRNKGVSLLHIPSCTWTEDLNFDEDDLHWRRLAEWCSTYPHRFTLSDTQDGLDQAYAIGGKGSRLVGEGNTLADAMQAAVLAHLSTQSPEELEK